jgi:hypothetical protein
VVLLGVLLVGCARLACFCLSSFLLGQEYRVVGQRGLARHRNQRGGCHISVTDGKGIFTQKSNAFDAIHHREDSRSALLGHYPQLE